MCLYMTCMYIWTYKIHMQELVNVCANVCVWVGDVLLMSLLLSMLSFAVCGWVGNVLLMSLYLYTVFYNVCVCVCVWVGDVLLLILMSIYILWCLLQCVCVCVWVGG